ncbi:MAG TPA: hypothetical protein VHA73_13225 [Acidimicrobiales bacterium]|nr:hypothetical protein [Acidimicrobiales bacterium]
MTLAMRRRRRPIGRRARFTIPRPRRPRWYEIVVPLVLIVVEVFGAFAGFGPDLVLGLLIGLLVGYLAYRRPVGAIMFMLFWIPFGVLCLSFLYKFGLPHGVVRGGALVKDLIAIAIFLAGWKARRDRAARTLPTIERIALAYLWALLFWFAITPLLAPGLHLNARVIGLRSLGLIVLLFVGVRWLKPDAEQRSAIWRFATGVAVALALGGIWQRLDRGGFTRFLTQTAGLPTYYTQVAGLTGTALSDALAWFRVGNFRGTSFVLAPFSFADLMLAGACIGIAGMTRKLTWRDGAVLGLCGAGVVLSGTRIDIIALGIVGAWAVLAVRGFSEAARVRFVAIALVALLAFVPGALTSRLTGSQNSISNKGHTNELTTSLGEVGGHPIGQGIGSDGAILRRSSTVRLLVSGNAVLGIGMQGGWLVMGLFIALVVSALVEARRHNRSGNDGPEPGGAMLMLIGGLVVGLTHNAWTDINSGSFAWILIALGTVAVGTRAYAPDSTNRSDGSTDLVALAGGNPGDGVEFLRRASRVP